MSDNFSALLKATLHNQSSPVFFWREQGNLVAISASNVWTLVLHRRHELRSMGLKSGDIWHSSAFDFSLIIDLVACAIGGNPLFVGNHNQNVLSTVKDSQSCLIFEGKDSNIPMILHSHQVVSQIQTTINILKLTSNEVRLCCLRPHNCAVLINDILCGIFAAQTIYIDFEEKSFQNPNILDKVIQQEEITTLAINSHICTQLGLTPTEIKDKFKLKRVYSVETLENY